MHKIWTHSNSGQFSVRILNGPTIKIWTQEGMVRFLGDLSIFRLVFSSNPKRGPLCPKFKSCRYSFQMQIEFKIFLKVDRFVPFCPQCPVNWELN